jgi:hypothetical protein
VSPNTGAKCIVPQLTTVHRHKQPTHRNYVNSHSVRANAVGSIAVLGRLLWSVTPVGGPLRCREFVVVFRHTLVIRYCTSHCIVALPVYYLCLVDTAYSSFFLKVHG